MKKRILTTLAVGIWVISASHSVCAKQIAPIPNYGTINSSVQDTNSDYLINRGFLNIIDPDGKLNNYGALNNSGRLIDFIRTNNYGALNNSGKLNNSGRMNNYGALNNSGKLNNYGRMNNYGALNNSGTVDGAGIYQQTSGITTNNGSMVQRDIQISGGQLSGTGTITGNVTIGAGATVKPGDPSGALTINGDFTSSGNFVFEIFGEDIGQYNQLFIDNGTALFTAGGMEFNFINDYQAEVGDHWNLLYATSIDGLDKLAYTLNGLDSGLGWNFEYMNGVGSLVITASPVPVPGAAWLLGSGLLGLAGLGRRRKAAVA